MSLWSALPLRAPNHHHNAFTEPVPWYVTFVSLFLGMCVVAGTLALVLRSTVAEAYADPIVYTGSTFTYQNQVYPATLVGSTVTFNANPGAPNSYGMGDSGYNIIWNSGVWYRVGGKMGIYNDTGQFFLSESSAANNPWYIAYNSGSYTSPMDGNFFDANHGWGNSSVGNRTLTFGYIYSLGDMSLSSSYPLLYHQGFIRYIVDNSDWRTRYTINSSASGDMTGTTTIGWLSAIGGTPYFGINTIITGSKPWRVDFWYSPTGESQTWEKLGTLTEPTATDISNTMWQYVWSTTRSGYFAVWAYLPNASAPTYVYNSDYVSYDESDNPSGGGSGSGGDSDIGDGSTSGDIIQDALNTLRSIYNGFRTFFDSLLGWLPVDIRNFFLAIVVVSLVIGLFRIIRGS